MSNEKMKWSFREWQCNGGTDISLEHVFNSGYQAALAQQASEPAQVGTRGTCYACSGSGYYDDDGSPECSSCGGEGSVEFLCEPVQVSQTHPADDNYMIVRKPEWKEHRIEKGEYFCCGGYTPCRGSCALFVAAPKGE